MLLSLSFRSSCFGTGCHCPGVAFQSDVSIRCYAVSIHDDTYSSLVSLGIDVIKSHDVYSLVLEITGRCQLEILCMQCTATAEQCQGGCE